MAAPSKPIAAPSMFTRLRQRLTTGGPAMVVAVIALSVALCGGAFAATASKTKKKSGVVITKLSQISPGVRNQLKGAAGPAGPVGPVGAGGARGDTGPAGLPGGEGDPGSPGANGEDVVVTAIPTGIARCEERGGTEVRLNGQVAGTGEEVCNGEPGAAGEPGEPGAPGSPWTAGGSLPAGSTETGSWAFNGTTEDTNGIRVPISFGIPYAVTNILPSRVHFGVPNSGGAFVEGTGLCPSASAANPQAAPAELCIYVNAAEGLENATYDGTFRYSGLVAGASKAGAMMKFTPTGVAYGAGSFALTAPNAMVTAVSPNQGPAAGGTSVTITGENLLTGTVKFGTVNATCSPATATEIVCTAPPQAAGIVDVRVTVAGYISPITAADHYTYE